MNAKQFIEKEYQENKQTWSLPSLDPRWKKFAIQVMEKYHEYKLSEPDCNINKLTNTKK